MAKFETAEAAARLEKVRKLIRKRDRTVTEVAVALNVSKPLATHYVQKLRDLKEIKVVDTVLVGVFRSPANLWGWVGPQAKPAPTKTPPGKARIVDPPRRDVVTLTRWVGGNPFERLTACGA